MIDTGDQAIVFNNRKHPNQIMKITWFLKNYRYFFISMKLVHTSVIYAVRFEIIKYLNIVCINIYRAIFYISYLH